MNMTKLCLFLNFAILRPAFEAQNSKVQNSKVLSEHVERLNDVLLKKKLLVAGEFTKLTYLSFLF